MPDPDDVAALVAHLQALEDPMQEAMPSFADVDWRTLAGRCARVISALEKDAARWQPIETAPRDGALLLLACSNWPHSEVLGKPVPIKVGGYWDGRWNVFGASWEPTHWMPLPAPPAALSQQKGGA